VVLPHVRLLLLPSGPRVTVTYCLLRTCMCIFLHFACSFYFFILFARRSVANFLQSETRNQPIILYICLITLTHAWSKYI
jgi:hypothetical protein